MALAAENFKIQEDEAISDEEVSEDAHHKLLNAVSKLYKKQRIEPPKHREPAHEISDFNLSTGIEGKDNSLTVNANELLGALKERATHRYITKQVKVSQKKTKKLPKPLEKNEEQKIARSVGYETVKKQLDKWSSIVERNKLASQLVFPLPSTKKINNKKNTHSFLTTFKEPTELEKEMAKVLDKSAIAKQERKEEAQLSKLSIEEMIERRNMTAKMRARESYRISKAIRQNKIKSKKYHRILKKEKIKQELKDFENLQKTDPEAALEKLEQIERARAEERISLRHRNTGKWARSKSIRAKYDTEARIQLAEQLAKSRELTRKVKENINSSSEDESEDDNDDEKKTISNRKKPGENGASDNPWMSEYVQFLDGYKTFSSEKSDVISSTEQNQAISPKDKNKNEESESRNSESTTPPLSESHQDVADSPSKSLSKDLQENQPEDAEDNNVEISNKTKDGSESEDEDEDEEEAINLDESNSDDDESSKQSRKNVSINDIFDEAEDLLKDHVKVSVKKIKSNLKLDKDIDEEIEENEKGTKKFDFKKSARLHDIDAALIEVADEGISSGLNDLSVLKEKLSLTESKKNKDPQIDPNKLITVKPQKLSSELPDLDENGDDSEEDEKEKEKHLNLMEAFAEDDIVDQFRQEKKEEEKTSKGKEIDLTMPGWGGWAGTGIEKKSRRKTRRLILRLPKVPRKDKKKPNVIINEDPVPKLREQLLWNRQLAHSTPFNEFDPPSLYYQKQKFHLYLFRPQTLFIVYPYFIKQQKVSELPYPFTSVKDYEASIRAPIGKNWVTEKGFRKLTAPPVVTKMGTIIEPMDSSLLVEKPKKRYNNNKPNVNSKKKKTN